MIAPSNVAVDNLLERLVAAAPAAEREQKLSTSSATSNGSAQRIKAIRLGHPARQSEAVLGHSLDAVLARTDGTKTPTTHTHIDISLQTPLCLLNLICDVSTGMEVVAGAKSELSKLQLGFKKKHSSYEHKSMQRQVKELRKDISARERKVFKEALDSCNVVCCTCIGASSSCLAK